jgi:hypothetical protein
MIIKGADISECGTYRYRLWRLWSRNPLVGFLMLNPSTADAETDDQTIRKCVSFAKRWRWKGPGGDEREYGGIMVTNLFALRTKSPKVLKAFEGDRIGPSNADFVIDEVRTSIKTVAAWGNHGEIGGMGKRYRKMLADRGLTLHHLGLTKLDQPRHPLYLPGDTETELWV